MISTFFLLCSSAAVNGKRIFFFKKDWFKHKTKWYLFLLCCTVSIQ